MNPLKLSLNALNETFIKKDNAIIAALKVKADAVTVYCIISSMSNLFSNKLEEDQEQLNENKDSISSNLDLINILEIKKANEMNSRLIGITIADEIRVVSNIYSQGTITASNLHIIGDTTVIETVTTLTDQFSISNKGTGSALSVRQLGLNSIAEFYSETELVMIINENGNIGIGTDSPTVSIDVIGSVKGTTFIGDVSGLTGLFAGQIELNDTTIFNDSLLLTTLNSKSQIDNPIFTGVVTLPCMSNVIIENISLATLFDNGIKIGASNHGSNSNAIAIGYNASTSNQVPDSIVINASGYSIQSVYSGSCFIKPINTKAPSYYVLMYDTFTGEITTSLLTDVKAAINGGTTTLYGIRVGAADQGANAVAIGVYAGKTAQGTNTVAIGYNAGNATQGATAIAIGVNAGSAGQGASAIAIGANAATTSQPANSIVINATGTIMGAEIAGGCFIKPVRNIIGESLAMYTLSSGEVSYIDTSTLMNMFVPSIVNSKIIAMGLDVVRIGSIGQGVNAVAVGINAGFTGQGANSIGIGKDAAMISQGANSMAIGLSAGRTAQGANAIAIGNFAGENAQAANAIAIGCLAGNNIQPARSIIINASGTELNITATDTDGCFIKPIKERLATTSVLMYNTLNSEITSCSVASIQSIANMNYAFASYTSGASQISNTAPSIVIFGGAYVHDAITVGGIATLTYSGGVFSFTHKCVVSISYSLQSPTDAILTAYLTTTTPIYSKLAGCTMPVICNGTHTLQMEAGGTVVLKIQSNTSVTNIEANISFLFHKIMR